MTTFKQFAIGISITLTALTLTVIPMPEWFTPFRPDWLTLLLIWWNIHYPKIFNVGSGWLAGLILDIIQGGLLGIYALGTTLASYLSVRITLQFKLYSFLQQMLIIAIIVLIYRFSTWWILSLTGQSIPFLTFMKPVIGDLLLWPWLNLLMLEVMRPTIRTDE